MKKLLLAAVLMVLAGCADLAGQPPDVRLAASCATAENVIDGTANLVPIIPDNAHGPILDAGQEIVQVCLQGEIAAVTGDPFNYDDALLAVAGALSRIAGFIPNPIEVSQ